MSVFYLVILLAACGGATTSSTSSSGTAAVPTCDKSTGLTLYLAQGYDSDAAKAFQKQTGITTKGAIAYNLKHIPVLPQLR